MTGFSGSPPHVLQSVLALDLPYLPRLHEVQVGANAAALDTARIWAKRSVTNNFTTDANQRCVLTWGAQGTGKTLLAQALVQETGAAYLHPRSNQHDFASAFTAQCVVADDIHAFDDARATAAFDIFNRLRASPNGHWWASSRVLPALMVGLRADVSSRMAWGLVFELLPLDDAASAQVLQTQAHRLGFELNDETAHYLLLRLERNLSVLMQHLASLNHYALALKKPVSKHLVQQWYAQIYRP